MKPHILVSIFPLLAGLFFSLPSLAGPSAAEVSCACPEKKCAPCEEDVGTDFFTEKCGPGLQKVKSCQRRDCQPVHDVASCRANLPVSETASTTDVVSRARTAPAVVAAPVAKPNAGPVDVVLAVGHVSVQKSNSENPTEEGLRTGMKISVGDRVVTGDDGRVRLRFEELSEVFVSPNSNIVVSLASIEKRERQSAKRTILLDLVKGRVRSRVQGRYGPADRESTFQIRTPAAVAGVRGTDFTVSFEQTDKKWHTDVRTLSGAVRLNGRSTDLSADVTAGTFAAYVVPAPPIGASAVEIEAALARGFMSPVFRMSDQDLRDLDLQMSFPPDQVSTSGPDGTRTPASDVSLCQAPRGNFNQCAWSCEGNPKGSKVCRTDLPKVSCVRRLCRASGTWAEATRLPASEGRSCHGAVGSEPQVGDCGGYW